MDGKKPIASGAIAGNEWLAPSDALTRMARPAPLTDGKTLRTTFVRFGYRVGSLRFLVGPGVLSELLHAPETYPIPNMPTAVRGYVNRQGALVPVWDLRLLLNDTTLNDSSIDSIGDSESKESADNRESILVLGQGDQRVALIINGLPRSLKNTERATRLPQLPGALNGYVKEALFADHNLWFEFDHEGFFRIQTEQAAA